MENTLKQLAERWNNVIWGMTGRDANEDDIPLLNMNEEDFEALEVRGYSAAGALVCLEELHTAKPVTAVNSANAALFNFPFHCYNKKSYLPLPFFWRRRVHDSLL